MCAFLFLALVLCCFYYICRVGTFGVVAEYGCEKQVTKFSTLGATVSIGIPIGVILKLK